MFQENNNNESQENLLQMNKFKKKIALKGENLKLNNSSNSPKI